MADIKIRNLEPYALKKIDELAKENKLSRNLYLKNALENFSYLELVDSDKIRLEKQIEMNNILMQSVIERLDSINSVLNDVLNDE